MKRIQGTVLLVLALALIVPAAYAETASHPPGNAMAEKAAKDYNKALAKQQRQQAKAQQKTIKQFKKLHPEFQGYPKAQ